MYILVAVLLHNMGLEFSFINLVELLLVLFYTAFSLISQKRDQVTLINTPLQSESSPKETRLGCRNCKIGLPMKITNSFLLYSQFLDSS